MSTRNVRRIHVSLAVTLTLATCDAVVAFQKRVGFDSDGIVGYHTRKALFPLLGFTAYLHVARSRADYPGGVAARAPALAFTGKDLKIKGLAAGGFRAKGLQRVYARNKDQDGHLELALGVQVLDTVLAQTSDGVGWAIQPFIQFTWADPFWHRGRFHLVAPFAQITAQTDPKLQDPVFGVGIFPVNITMDIIQDRLSIIGQAGVVGGRDVANKRGEIGSQAAIVGSWSF